MLVLISPAKSQNFDIPIRSQTQSQPVFLEESKKLIGRLQKLTPPQIGELMDISPKLSELNFERYQNFSLPFTNQNAKQAGLVFTGDVYQGLNMQSFSESELAYAQQHLRILSGLYGVLKPLDLIQPYRLEMKIKLKYRTKANLYAFWDEKITKQLNSELKEAGKNGSSIILNLASNEYFKAVKTAKLKAKVVTPVFKEWKNDKYKVIALFAKKARGMMARYVMQNQLEDLESLKGFSEAGYLFNAELSQGEELVFTRKQA